MTDLTDVSPEMTPEEAAAAMKDMAEQVKEVSVPIVMKPPSPDSKGYLKRMARIVRFQATVTGGKLDEPALDDLVEFLSEYVVKPADRDEAKELIWDLSENEFMKALSLMGGATDEVPPQSSES